MKGGEDIFCFFGLYDPRIEHFPPTFTSLQPSSLPANQCPNAFEFKGGGSTSCQYTCPDPAQVCAVGLLLSRPDPSPAII